MIPALIVIINYKQHESSCRLISIIGGTWWHCADSVREAAARRDLSKPNMEPLPCEEESERRTSGVLPATTAQLDGVCRQATAKSRATIRAMFLMPRLGRLSARLSAPQQFKAWSRWSVMPFPIWWRAFCQALWVRCWEQRSAAALVQNGIWRVTAGPSTAASRGGISGSAFQE